MPIDSSIPLQVHAPQITPPMEAAGQALSLRNLAQSGQLQQQQIQGHDLENQQRQMELDSQKAVQQAYLEANGDFDKLPDLAAKKGALPKDIMGINQHVLQFRKSLAEGKELDLKNMHTIADAVAAASQNILSSDPAKQPAVYEQSVADLTKRGFLKPGEAPTTWADLQTATSQNGTTPQDWLRMHVATGLGTKGEIDRQFKANADAREQAEANRKTRTEALQKLSGLVDSKTGVPAPEDLADWQKQYPNILPPNPTPQAIANAIRSSVPVDKQPEYDINSMKAKMGVMGNGEFDQFLAQYAKSLGKTPATLAPQQFFDGMGQFAVLKQDPQMRQLAQQQKDISLAMLRIQQQQAPTQEDIDTLAQAVVSHDMAPSQFAEIKGRGVTSGIGLKLITRARQLDPKFSMARADSEFKAMEKTESDFASGKKGDLVRANNNAIEHLGLLDRAREALSNGNIQVLNRVANQLGVQVGSDAKTTFDLIGKRVSDEVSKAFIPGGGGVYERMAGAEDFSSKMADPQLKSNIQASIGLMDSQQRNLQHQYKEGTYGKGNLTLFTPEAMAERDRIMGQTGTTASKITAAAEASRSLPKGNGKIIDKATAQKFYEAAGRDPKKAQELAEKNNWKVQ